MRRVPPLRSRALLLLLLSALLWPLIGSPVAQSQDRPSDDRPNIVVVMTDDQDVESMAFMPRLRRVVADRGVTFTHNTVSFSLCCPSRATFLTGQLAHNNNVRSNSPPDGGYGNLRTDETLPVWLQRAGYATGHVGKYPNGYDLASHPLTNGVPPGWNDWRGAPEPTTYYYFGYTLNENGELVSYGHSEADYQTDVFTRLATRFIRKRAPRPQPFFLSVAYVAPHWESPPGSPGNQGVPPVEGGFEGTNLPPVPAPRHAGVFAGATAPRPPSFNEADMQDKPQFFRQMKELDFLQEAQIDQWYRARLESLQAVDEGVERLVATLEQTGELENTVFVFTSDNGWFQGEHRIQLGKIHVYEPSTRIPLVVRGPGVASGATVGDWTSNVDLPATVLALARAPAGLPQDGMSLVPYLSAPGTRLGRVVFHETTFPNGGYTALRAGPWKYVEYATGERELYDLAGDPHELESRHADPLTEPVRAHLAGLVAPLRSCRGADCVVTEGGP